MDDTFEKTQQKKCEKFLFCERNIEINLNRWEWILVKAKGQCG